MKGQLLLLQELYLLFQLMLSLLLLMYTLKEDLSSISDGVKFLTDMSQKGAL